MCRECSCWSNEVERILQLVTRSHFGNRIWILQNIWIFFCTGWLRTYKNDKLLQVKNTTTRVPLGAGTHIRQYYRTPVYYIIVPRDSHWKPHFTPQKWHSHQCMKILTKPSGNDPQIILKVSGVLERVEDTRVSSCKKNCRSSLVCVDTSLFLSAWTHTHRQKKRWCVSERRA